MDMNSAVSELGRVEQWRNDKQCCQAREDEVAACWGTPAPEILGSLGQISAPTTPPLVPSETPGTITIEARATAGLHKHNNGRKYGQRPLVPDKVRLTPSDGIGDSHF